VRTVLVAAVHLRLYRSRLTVGMVMFRRDDLAGRACRRSVAMLVMVVISHRFYGGMTSELR
jgi:hypothetical protein